MLFRSVRGKTQERTKEEERDVHGKASCGAGARRSHEARSYPSVVDAAKGEGQYSRAKSEDPTRREGQAERKRSCSIRRRSQVAQEAQVSKNGNGSSPKTPRGRGRRLSLFRWTRIISSNNFEVFCGSGCRHIKYLLVTAKRKQPLRSSQGLVQSLL